MANPVMSDIYEDGSFATAAVAGPLRISHSIQLDPTAKVAKQQYKIRAALYDPLRLASNLDTVAPYVITIPGAVPAPGYLVEETAPAVDEHGIAVWDRVYATLPGPRTEYSGGTKQFKQLQPVYNSSGQLILDSLATWSAVVALQKNYTYYRGRTASVYQPFPGVPDCIFINLGPLGTFVVGVGGFVVVNGAGNNFGTTFMTGEINRYMGDLWERVDIFALAQAY